MRPAGEGLIGAVVTCTICPTVPPASGRHCHARPDGAQQLARSRVYADAPGLFHHLPEQFRLEIVEKSLGPSAGWFVKDKMAQVPCLLGYTPERAEVLDGNHEVRLHLRAADGSERKVVTGHIIAATGYKVNLDRLTFLNSEIGSRIKTAKGSPVL